MVIWAAFLMGLSLLTVKCGEMDDHMTRTQNALVSPLTRTVSFNSQITLKKLLHLPEDIVPLIVKRGAQISPQIISSTSNL